MTLLRIRKRKTLISELRVQRYRLFRKPPNFSAFFLHKSRILRITTCFYCTLPLLYDYGLQKIACRFEFYMLILSLSKESSEERCTSQPFHLEWQSDGFAISSCKQCPRIQLFVATLSATDALSRHRLARIKIGFGMN